MPLTQEEFSSKFVYAERQPQRRGDAGEADDQCVHVYAGIDGLETVEGIPFVFVHDHNARDVTDGSRRVGETFLELFVTVEQLGEPDHEGVVTETFIKNIRI